MREIKFRQWYKGQFHYFGYANGLIQGPCSASLERDPIDQYTGVRDGNSKEAYEGDIIEFYDGSTYAVGVVKYGGTWQYAGFGIVTYGVDSETWDALNVEWDGEFTIIGNIHENPELLK